MRFVRVRHALSVRKLLSSLLSWKFAYRDNYRPVPSGHLGLWRACPGTKYDPYEAIETRS